MRMRLTMKPGRSADTMTCLPSSAARAADRPRPSRRSCRRARMSSTSGMTGTGLKKCIPMNRAASVAADGVGQPVDRDRARVRGEDRRRRGAARRARARAPCLTAEVLEHGLDDEVGVGRARPARRSASMRASVASRVRGVEPALGDRPLRGCRRSARGRPRPARAPARTGSRPCRSPRGPGRSRGPSARRRRRRPSLDRHRSRSAYRREARASRAVSASSSAAA